MCAMDLSPMEKSQNSDPGHWDNDGLKRLTLELWVRHMPGSSGLGENLDFYAVQAELTHPSVAPEAEKQQ